MAAYVTCLGSCDGFIFLNLKAVHILVHCLTLCFDIVMYNFIQFKLTAVHCTICEVFGIGHLAEQELSFK